jgi:arylsulfatase A-like enzyme
MNIIVIIVDDLGYNDVGYNGSNIPTPNIDNLSRESIKFTRFYAYPGCTPTRASLLTGCFAYRIGQQRIIWPWNESGLTTNKKLLPQYLDETDSYVIGKWNLGHCQKKYQPCNRGFIKHYGNLTGCIDHYDYFYPLPAGGPKLHDFTEDGYPVYPKGHTTDILTNKTIEIIKNRNKQKDFFIYLAYNAPHVPLQAPSFYINKFKNIKDNTKKNYAAMVNHLDDCIGKIINELKLQNLLENTLIWFTSDNGGWLGHGGDNGKLKGGKTNFYEGGIRIVNFLYCSKFKPRIDNNPRHITDIFSTLLKLKNKDYESLDVDGKDVFSFSKERELVHGLFPINKKEMHGCISIDNYKLIVNDKKIEIYDLESDPFEQKNIAKNEKIKKRLIEVIFDKKKNYFFTDVFSYNNPKGYPDGYRFPKWWGQKRNSKIKIMNNNSLYFDKNKNFNQILGYDVFDKLT